MRLIDADILREEILDDEDYIFDNDTVNHFLDLVDLSSTIDAEPVVRCKDCKHRNKEYGEEFCEVLGRLTNDKFYCSYGAKMDEV